ncbi:DNA cytosine methyltransferase [Salmonella enterica subsp. enterica serovar Mbandaka]|nr:DNA cytosine methyltransferase [Salmonella enterica subsp. enterica serovar Mbandaka]MCR3282330.1 DNA cytosine methyltransferase [Salmonella enterica subsp. enterica serovar Mbandaka]MCR3316815.1 DNA cytosine methyltransferase [Salmonella enterica subsp. enterica serovar Mbandaka]
MNYYNEWDPQAAAWLRELISERLIPRGLVDERSITEVKAEDLEGFTQCHFFAGIGGWPLALQLAGVDNRTPLWTGSPPCQPFSAAGKQLGQFDPRHLAPVFLGLISQCRPPVLFGEQVAPAIAKSWMCDLQTHLEGEDYAVGFAVLPACSVGAPHKRERLFFGAHQLAHTMRKQFDRSGASGPGRWAKPTDSRAICGLAYPNNERLERRQGMPECADEQSAWPGSVESELAHATSGGRGEECQNTGRLIVGDSAERRPARRSTSSGDNTTNPHNSFWSDADWLGCRDGKFRPVEPGTFPLANGIPARVGRLRGYGNAIVPEVAAEFVRAFLAASDDAIKG